MCLLLVVEVFIEVCYAGDGHEGGGGNWKAC